MKIFKIFAMEYSNILEKISEGIKNKNFAIFCGAGISKNSGLPTVPYLARYILEKLGMDRRDIEEIMPNSKLKLPFEAFMEVLAENSDISKILEIFKQGEPNTNHIFIAKLAKAGLIKTIATTNFDMLIETALEEEGLKRGENFDVYYTEMQFYEIDFDALNKNNKISVFKLHGGIEDEKSIRTTLKLIASKVLSETRMNVIRHLFSTGNHKKVLVLGYSCSDEFDITPQIQSLKRNLKEIIFVDHSEEEKEEVEDIKNKDSQNPFKKFSGKRIKCNTDKFIERLWSSLGEITGEYKLIKCEVKWEEYVDEWAKKLEEDKGYLKYYIAGHIFYRISNFNRALKYSEKSLVIAEEIGDKEGEPACHVQLGILYRNLGDSKKAIKYYEEALKNFKLLGNITYEALIYENLGMAYFTLGDFKNALDYYENSLKIVKEIRKIGNISRNFPKFVKSYKESCKEKTFSKTSCYIDPKGFFTIVPPPGWKVWEYKEDPRGKVVFIGDGHNVDLRILVSRKNFSSFEELLEIQREKAKDIERRFGIKVAIEKTAFLNKPAIKRSWIYSGIKFFAIEFMEGNIRHDLQYGAPLKLYEKYFPVVMKSMETYEPIPKNVEDESVRKHVIANKLRLATINIENIESACYEGLGIIYRNLGDLKKSIGYYKKALKIKKEAGDKGGEATCYSNLSVVYVHLMNSKKAMEYVKKALEISKQIGDEVIESKCYSNLSAIYGKLLKNFRKAIEYAKKSLEIKREIGDRAGEAKCYLNLGAAYCNLGDFKKAIEYYLKAEKIFKELGQEHYLKTLYENMAICTRKMKNFGSYF